MTASTETLQTVRSLSQEGYKYGFVTDIEAETRAAGPRRGHRPLHFGQEGRAGVAARMAAAGVPRLARDDRAGIGPSSQLRRSTTRRPSTIRAPKQSSRPEILDEVDPELLRTYEKLGIPLREREALAGVAVDAVFDTISVATTFKEQLGEARHHLLPDSEAVREHPELVRKYLGTVVPQNDNFFAALNSAVFSDGSFVYIPPGVRCPMELSTYFRINAARPGSSNAPADRRQGRLCQLSRRLHGAEARREPAARRGRRAGRA